MMHSEPLQKLIGSTSFYTCSSAAFAFFYRKETRNANLLDFFTLTQIDKLETVSYQLHFIPPLSQNFI